MGARLSALPIFSARRPRPASRRALYVAGRMLMAPRPAIALAAPFDVVGATRPSSLDVRTPRPALAEGHDPAGRQGADRRRRDLRAAAARGPLSSGGRRKTGPLPPGRGAGPRAGRGAQRVLGPLLPGQDGDPGEGLHGPPDSAPRRGPHHPALRQPGRLRHGRLPGHAARRGERRAGGRALVQGLSRCRARGPAVRFAIFAFPYDAPAATPVHVKARDEAGNEVVASFNVKVFPRQVPHAHAAHRRRVPGQGRARDPEPHPVPDRPGRPPEELPAINRDLRAANNKALAELAARSQPRLLWREPFRQLGNSQVEASFADHRIYVYKGREVDKQDHLGYDLATTAHAPVSASNDGVVLLADYFGIYGNTIVDRPRLRPALGVRPPGQLRGQGRRRREARPGHRAERLHRPGRGRPPALLGDPPGRAGGRARVVGPALDPGPHPFQAARVRGRRRGRARRASPTPSP